MDHLADLGKPARYPDDAPVIYILHLAAIYCRTGPFGFFAYHMVGQSASDFPETRQQELSMAHTEHATDII